MAEYQDILKFLASNPPQVDSEKRFHASLLEMLAKKLRGKKEDSESTRYDILKDMPAAPAYKKGYN
jgi:hypothetical protein